MKQRNVLMLLVLSSFAGAMERKLGKSCPILPRQQAQHYFVDLDEEEKAGTILKSTPAQFVQNFITDYDKNFCNYGDQQPFINGIEVLGFDEERIPEIEKKIAECSYKNDFLVVAKLMMECLKRDVVVDKEIGVLVTDNLKTHMHESLVQFEQEMNKFGNRMRLLAAIHAVLKQAVDDTTPAANYELYGDPVFLAEKMSEIRKQLLQKQPEQQLRFIRR